MQVPFIVAPFQFVTLRLRHSRAPSPANPRQSRVRHPELHLQRQPQNQSTSRSTTAVVSSPVAMRQSQPHKLASITPREWVGHPPFVLQGNTQFGGTIYIRTEPSTGFYQMAQGNSDFGYYGASALSHEQVHLNGGGEYPAFQRQESVFQGFERFFQNPALYRGLDESIRDGIKANQPQ